MKDFFKDELKNLKAKTGLNQYETFSNMPEAEKQIGILLDSMVLVCNEFPYIPDMDKCTIIQKMIIQDQDFTALNSRAVWKWLNMHKDVYWGKANGKQEEVIDNLKLPPLSDETKKIISEFQAKLLEKDTPKFPGLDLTMDAIKHEDMLRLEGEESKPKGTPSNMPSWTVPIEDDNGNVLKEISNVLAPTQEKAKEYVELSIREGKLLI